MDKVYNSKDKVIDPIHKIHGQIVMPSKSNAIDQRDYDQHLYKARHLIENFFAKLKQYRGIATHYDKLAQNFLSAIYPAQSGYDLMMTCPSCLSRLVAYTFVIQYLDHYFKISLDVISFSLMIFR